MPDKLKVFIHSAGLISYRQAVVLQETLHAAVVRGEISGVILILEHPATITLGKHATLADLHLDPEVIREKGIDLCETERGGKLTAHMPGQLVVYPIIPMNALKLTTKSYVHALEKSMIATLQSFQIAATADSQYPGVWVGTRKIGAIGIRIKERVAMHGVALNVTNDLEVFSYFTPCGINDRGVTTMRQETSVPLSVGAVATILTQELARRIDIFYESLDSQVLCPILVDLELQTNPEKHMISR